MDAKTELHQIKDQFKARAKTFNNSAKWVKDAGLLAIYQKLAKVSSGDLVLEACCGTGVVGQSLSESGAKVIGVDLSSSMLGEAKRKLFFCINGQAERLPLKDGIFDLVICRQAFHFLELKQAVKEMFRVTNPKGGKIVISQIVPFGKKDKDWVYQIHRKKQPLLKNFLVEEDLKCLLEEAGFINLTLQEYCIEEPISSWLVDTYFSKGQIKEIKRMFTNAPDAYKRLHKIRMCDGEIFDTMRWVIFQGIKCSSLS